MKDFQAKCPNLLKISYSSQKEDTIVCGYAGYEVLVKGIFTKESGFDPLAMKVKCRRCEQEYYLFPQVNFKGVSNGINKRSFEKGD